MTMRDKIAALMWRTQAVDVGAPASVANARTPEAFSDESQETRDTWLKQADAILAALPGMVPELVWEGPSFGFYSAPTIGGIFRAAWDTSPRDGDHYTMQFDRDEVEMFPTFDAAKAAANAHHRAAVCEAMGLPEVKP